MKRTSFQRGRNILCDCRCCGKKTHSSIDNVMNVEMCRECFEFQSALNSLRDGGAFEDLPKPKHECAFCQREYPKAVLRYAPLCPLNRMLNRKGAYHENKSSPARVRASAAMRGATIHGRVRGVGGAKSTRNVRADVRVGLRATHD
jgi:hypothetical protein